MPTPTHHRADPAGRCRRDPDAELVRHATSVALEPLSPRGCPSGWRTCGQVHLTLDRTPRSCDHRSGWRQRFKHARPRARETRCCPGRSTRHRCGRDGSGGSPPGTNSPRSRGGGTEPASREPPNWSSPSSSRRMSGVKIVTLLGTHLVGIALARAERDRGGACGGCGVPAAARGPAHTAWAAIKRKQRVDEGERVNGPRRSWRVRSAPRSQPDRALKTTTVSDDRAS